MREDDVLMWRSRSWQRAHGALRGVIGAIPGLDQAGREACARMIATRLGAVSLREVGPAALGGWSLALRGATDGLLHRRLVEKVRAHAARERAIGAQWVDEAWRRAWRDLLALVDEAHAPLGVKRQWLYEVMPPPGEGELQRLALTPIETLVVAGEALAALDDVARGESLTREVRAARRQPMSTQEGVNV